MDQDQPEPAMCDAELTWLANQSKKVTGERSKYVPHQGAREKAKRVKREQGCD